MLPEKLVIGFWLEVFQELVQKHRFSIKNAAAAVVAFRDVIERQVGDMIYHRDADVVAETVADGWNSGFLKPTAAGAAQP